MYFIPMTRRIPESARRRPIEQDTGLYAGAIVIQTDRPMDNMQSLARQTLAAINPNLSVVKFQTFDEQIADRFTQDRMITRLMTLFSILALLLATLGLYGVTAYTVARRTSEIGIRMALGANRSSVVAMIMRGAMTPNRNRPRRHRHPRSLVLRPLHPVPALRNQGHEPHRPRHRHPDPHRRSSSSRTHPRPARSLNQPITSIEDGVALAVAALLSDG